MVIKVIKVVKVMVMPENRKHLVLTSRKSDILQAPIQTDHLAGHQVKLVHLSFIEKCPVYLSL